MLARLLNSAAVIAATAVLAGPALSQTAAPAVSVPQAPAVQTAPAPVAPVPEAAPNPAANAPVPATPPAVPAPQPPATGAPAPAAADAPQAPLPAVLGDLGISDATARPGPKGDQRIEGTLPGGVPFRAATDPQGQLRMLRASDDEGVLPDEIVRRLVPEPIRNAPIFAEFARVQGLNREDGETMLRGADSKGQPVRAMFTEDGTLQRFGRGEDAGRWMMHKRDGRGPGAEDRGGPREGHGKGPKGPRPGEDACDFHGKAPHRHDDRHGERFDDRSEGPAGWRGGQGPDGGPDAGPRGDRPHEAAPPRGPDGAPAPMDDAAVRSILTEGGYSDIGEITHDGPRTQAAAKNPEGENVWVTINPRGVVVRELAR